MGMFDWVVCDHPLPGTIPSFVKDGHQFQTKDFDNRLEVIRIEEDGTCEDAGTSEVYFYGSNVCGSGPALYTSDGSDAESVEFKAVFVDGKLTDIEQTSYKREPAFPSSKQGSSLKELHGFECRSDNVSDDSHLGKKLYSLWGGSEEGCEVEVIAENDKQLVVKKEDGTFELAERFRFGLTLFVDEEDAWARRNYKNKNWTLRKEEFEKYKKEWNEKNANS